VARVYGNDGGAAWCTVGNAARFFTGATSGARRQRPHGRVHLAGLSLAGCRAPPRAYKNAFEMACPLCHDDGVAWAILPARAGAAQGPRGIKAQWFLKETEHEPGADSFRLAAMVQRRHTPGFPSMQGSLQEGWTKALEQFQNFDAAELGLPAGQGAVPNIRFEPRQQQVHQGYLKEAAELWNQSLQSSLSLADRRFNGEAWERNPMASFAAAVYLLNARTLMSLAEAAETDAKTKARMRFAVEQWVAASAPSNFLAFNAEAQKKAVATKGESTRRAEPAGRHAPGPCVDDRREPVRGRPNVATTEGAVVFENELFQLIEYKPLTAKVHERPFLLVPPCINKFYILDLQPDNSFIRYAVSQGTAPSW
jgi:hypothetical protein